MTEQSKIRLTPAEVRRSVGPLIVWLSLVLIHGLVQPTSLIDYIPFAATLISGSLGLVAGYYFYTQLTKSERQVGGGQKILLAVLLPVVFALTGTYTARVVFEAASFSGAARTKSALVGVVTSIDDGFRFPQLKATVEIQTGLRDVTFKVSEDLYNRLEPYRHPGRDCIAVTVETGRWGYRRALVPSNLFGEPIGISRYALCKNSGPGS